MAEKFDVAIVGTGTAASTVASICREAKWRVAVVDSRPFGGTCALRGCDPKKVLVSATQAVDWVRRMKQNGIESDGVRIDWPALMRFKRSFTNPVPKAREEGFAKQGIAAFHGRAHFTGPRSLRIGETELEARYVVVAAGSRPSTLKIPGEDLLITSDQFLELDALPRRLIFVGGGYISFEFAHVAARAGAQVTILHRDARPLPGFDPGLVDLLLEQTRQLGIDVQLNAAVEGIEKESNEVAVHAACGKEKRAFLADMAIHGAGRVPEIDDLGLSAAGVEWDPRKGVKVNEYLQSVSNTAVYSAGDAAASGGLPLTPVAGYEGRVVASNLVNGNRATPDYTGAPTVVFTTPCLTAVGLLEAKAREKGLKFRSNHANTARWSSSRRIGEKFSGYNVLIEEGAGRILGAHLLGDQSEELINVFALAIRSGMTADQLKDALFAYPTHASNIAYMV